MASERSSAGEFINKRVTVQPILICDDMGQNCPAYNASLFEIATDKIWSQAQTDIQFLPLSEFHSSAFQTIEDASKATQLFSGANHGQNPDTNVVNLWIAKQIIGAYGRALTGQNGVVIDDDIFTTNGGQGRLDTIAHEIGHNLGLDHFAYGAGGPENLMTAEGRLIPGNLCDIVSSGLATDQLNDVQRAIARGSRFAQNIPAFQRTIPTTILIIGSYNTLSSLSEASICYQLQKAQAVGTNMTWTNIGNLRPGTNGVLVWPFLPDNMEGYFRLQLHQ